MRAFYVLLIDAAREDLQSVVDDDLAGFDGTPLRRGERVGGVPAGMWLAVSDGRPADLLGNAFGWKIMSGRALAAVAELVPGDDLQVLHPRVVTAGTANPVTGYHLVNCLRVFPVLAHPPAGMVYADQLIIRDASVPAGTHLFCPAEAPRHWVASEQLWERLSGLDGFYASPARTVA